MTIIEAMTRAEAGAAITNKVMWLLNKQIVYAGNGIFKKTPVGADFPSETITEFSFANIIDISWQVVGEEPATEEEVIEARIKVKFPIVKSYSSDNYGLVIEDSAGITHYWHFDYSYDGWAGPPCTDFETGTNMN